MTRRQGPHRWPLRQRNLLSAHRLRQCNSRDAHRPRRSLRPRRRPCSNSQPLKKPSRSPTQSTTASRPPSTPRMSTAPSPPCATSRQASPISTPPPSAQRFTCPSAESNKPATATAKASAHSTSTPPGKPSTSTPATSYNAPRLTTPSNNLPTRPISRYKLQMPHSLEELRPMNRACENSRCPSHSKTIPTSRAFSSTEGAAAFRPLRQKLKSKPALAAGLQLNGRSRAFRPLKRNSKASRL